MKLIVASLAGVLGAAMQEANDQGNANSGGGAQPGTPAPTPAKKPKAEVTLVKMSDGREVGFTGKRKMVKETLIDDSKIALDSDTVTMQKGAVNVRIDFRNGETRLFALPVALMAKAAGHGGEQKLGDETAGEEKIEDMILAVDDLLAVLNGGEWNRKGEAGGFSGASIVIRAIMEATKDAEGNGGKTQEEVKAFLQGKLDKAEKAGQKLTRRDLYDSFRNPNSKTGQIIERLEREDRAKNNKVDADAALDEFKAEPVAA